MELMTEQEILQQTLYLRQQDIGLKLPKCVAVVGVGGVGSWLAYFLALAGVSQLILFDHDDVSDHNLNRLPLLPQHVGWNKAEAIAQMIRQHRPGIDITAFGKFVPELVNKTDVAKLADWVVAGTDSLKSRQMVAKWAAEKNVRYLEIAAEGEIGSVTGAPAEWANPEEELPGYQSVPVWVGPCVMCAAVACAHILHAVPVDSERVYRMGWENDRVEMKLL